MMRSLYSAVSGLKTHQTRMDVIGNNIANVNTEAFKASNVRFSEIMYQTTASASGGNGATGTGGVNAKQIGLGVTTGSTTVNITGAGASETTGNPFDLKLTDSQSTNFFIVSDGTNRYFTRAGSFYVDGNGYLCMSSTGYTLQGWQVDPTTGEIRKDVVSPLQVMSPENQTASPEATTKAYASGVLDKNDSNVNADDGYVMNLGFYDDLGYSYTAKFAVKPIKDKGTVVAGKYQITLTDVINSESKSILDANEADKKKQIERIFGKDGYKIEYDTNKGTFVSIVPIGDNGNQKPVSQLLKMSALTTGDKTDLGNGQTQNSNFKDIEIDFSKSMNYDNGGTSTFKMLKGDSTGDGAGKKLGALTGISVDQQGCIHGSYDNGNTILLGQIAVAQFANASGLEKVGNNCYQTTLNSGEFDGIGVEVNADGSAINSGELEMSNVDLSGQFTDMIVTQRGFQANSRVITTSDTLLEELINLKR